MSSLLKRYAMLEAVSNHNQHHYNNGNSTQVTTIMTEITATAKTATTITISTTAVTLPRTTKLINSNKSTLIQLKQQQHQQQDIFYTTTSLPPPPPFNSSTTTTTTNTRRYPLNSDKPTLFSDHQSDTIDGDSSSFSLESSETIGLNENVRSTKKTGDSGQRQQPQNTYTSTTYYGSGFGVFHQQNIRSNGGGIALITGSTGANGHLGNSSYSTGINNNVNLLLGGAMLTLITTILCVVCYCCHRNIKKRTEAAYRQQHQWLENDPNMEIYSVEQCYETSGLFIGESMDGLVAIPALHHEPPPSYDAVVAMQEQQQQHLMMQQQQQLMQLIPNNNSPPPGYRSSLDVSSMIQQVRTGHGILALGTGLTGMESNSVASSTSSIRASISCSPSNDPLGNYNDLTANMAAALATNSNQLSQTNFLRNKQQRNVNPTNLTQLNMKKVLQAQSCCSLQRAEVENMWNAAAAALAARSGHHSSEPRTAAATSSPALAMNIRKLSQGPTTSRTNMPETFGSRYLKQNYYRSGCPLCGKFRYDNDSSLSISMDSNLDGAETDAGARNENGNFNNNRADEDEISQCNSNNNNQPCNMDKNDNDGDDDNNDNDDDEDADVGAECSCVKRIRKKHHKAENPKSLQQQQAYQQLTLQQNSEVNTCNNIATAVETPVSDRTDVNANMPTTEERHVEQTATTLPSNNNNNNSITEASGPLSQPALTIVSSATTSSASPVTIDLDCITENGIISLDMSKIIDKTGLPTYDAALKLESSGYV